MKFEFLENIVSWNSEKTSSQLIRKTANLTMNHFFRNLRQKIINTFDDKWSNCWDWSGAKECTSCRSRKMLKNMIIYYLLYLVFTISLQRSASIQPRTSPKYHYEISMICVLLILSPACRSPGRRGLPLDPSAERWVLRRPVLAVQILGLSNSKFPEFDFKFPNSPKFQIPLGIWKVGGEW